MPEGEGRQWKVRIQKWIKLLRRGLLLSGPRGRARLFSRVFLPITFLFLGDKWGFLEPVGASTVKYVSKVWTLLNQGGWPPSTPPGELHSLHFRMHLQNESFVELRTFDAAGQDFRRLFESEQILSSELPAKLQEVAAYCQQADIIVFVVNTGDFVEEPNIDRRAGTEAALKAALDIILQDSRRCASIVLTQIDKCMEAANKAGVRYALAERMIPSVFGGYIAKRKLDVVWVAAVADTQDILERERWRRVPRPGFGSLGLESLMEWLSTTVRDIKLQGEKELRLRQRAESLRQFKQKWASVQRAVRLAAAVLVFCLLLVFFVAAVRRPDGPPPPPPPAPPPEVNLQTRGQRWLFDHGVEVSGVVRNPSHLARNGVIRPELYENNKRVQEEVVFLRVNSLGTETFRREIWKLYSLRNPWKVRYSVLHDP